MNSIPEQLQRHEFRFFLAIKNGKTPIEKAWNSENNYTYFETDLQDHLKKGGNIGIVTGYGNLIVVDFDDKAYQEKISNQLPQTFTVISATRRLKHFYYVLKGEMFTKIAIGIKKRLCDVQAAYNAVICPPSIIKTCSYDVIHDIPIATIDYQVLHKIFGLITFKTPLTHGYDEVILPEKINQTIEILVKANVKRTKPRHFSCPYHPMAGQGNLSVMGNGALYCFHCMKYARDAESFLGVKNGK